MFWTKKKQLKDLDRNQLIIKWADELIFHSDHLGKINKNSLMPGSFQTPEEIEVWRKDEEGKLRNHVISLSGNTNGNLDVATNEMVGYLEGIKNHLLSHRYVKDPVPPNYEWVLSDIGWTVKELEGHFKYKQHRKREIGILKHQNTINWLLFSTALASVIFPFIIAIFLQKDTNVNVQPQSIVTQVDSLHLRSLVEDILKSKDTMKKEAPQKKETPTKQDDITQ